MKQCRKCLQFKPESAFVLRRESGKLRNECIDCRNARSRENYWKNKERYDAYHAEYRKKHADQWSQWATDWNRKHPEKRRSIRLRHCYGITASEYERMLELQGGACAICGETPKKKTLSVDHVHVDGYENFTAEEKKKYVRGLICQSCNVTLGRIKENIQTLKNMIVYLERSA
jgi:hypothetical protein